ncbi:uncharacterized protein LOC143067285 isoform X1 [Mytilus galloprovincialis]|uniref:uncharacterized protein LOC143067285 isoform X1 n=1 Tax=Mytilus galloprovincialis TaxID=29158 RepID=UPI003F7C62DD
MNTERLNKLNMLVFKQANIRKMQDAIKSLFDIFHDILEKDFDYGAYYCASEILQRLQSVDQKYWKDIRNLYLHDEYYGYSDGNFSDDEMNNPAKLIMDMLSVLCKCKEGVMEKVEQKTQEMQQLEAKHDEMRNKTTDLYQQLLDEKRENADRKMEFAKLQGKVNLMERMVEEKTNKITELLKDKTVQLSVKEKEKLLENANKKIDELEEEIMEMKASKQRATRRMSCIDDQNKILKLKQERTSYGEDCVDGELGSTDEVQQLKREIYVKDKDIAHLEDQFYSEQKVVLGIIGGIRTDVNILSEKFYIEEEHIRDPDFVKLTKYIDKIYNSATEGRLAIIKNMLPPHYTYYDKELKVKKLRRLSKAASVPHMIPPEINRTPLPTIGAALGTLGSRTSNGQITSIPETPTPTRKLDVVCENPVIINPGTGRINSMVYLMHFPHMAQNFVLDHWKKFKEYDTDNDSSLDLLEVTKILQNIGCQYTPDQIEEAIEEVDRDNSHTLDFFEYLLVVDKITKKSGKGKLFQSGLKQNQEASKACVIQ